MGVYIKGMEMPKNCALCKLRGAGETWCPFTLREVPGNTIPEDCPLIPVPPHGRLIDADVVFKQLQKQAMSVWGNGNPRYQIVLEVMDAIRFAPTVIEAEEGE